MNLRLRYFGIGLLLASLVSFGAVTFAQDATETSEPVSASTEARVVGDANAESLQVVRSYLEDGNTDVIAEDVVFFDRTLPEPVTGRDPFLNSQTAFHGGAFADFFFTPLRYIVADNVVVVEFEFTGTTNTDMIPAGPVPAAEPVEEVTPDAEATEALADAAALGANIRVPMLTIYEVSDGQIVRVDSFYDAAAMQYQLGYDPYYDPYYAPYYAAPVGAATVSVLVELDVDDIVENPDRYIGQRVIVQGQVGAALDDRSFLLMDNDLIDLDDEQILVMDASEDGLGFIQLADADVLVAGVLQSFSRADLEQEYGWTLDEAAYGPYEGTPVLLAENAINLYDVATIDNIVGDPAAFYGQSVSVSGDVAAAVTEQAFLLEDDDLIDLDPERLLVIYPPMLPVIDEDVIATGTVREFIRAEIESELGITLDEATFGQYENQPVLVAETVYDWD